MGWPLPLLISHHSPSPLPTWSAPCFWHPVSLRRPLPWRENILLHSPSYSLPLPQPSAQSSLPRGSLPGLPPVAFVVTGFPSRPWAPRQNPARFFHHVYFQHLHTVNTQQTSVDWVNEMDPSGPCYGRESPLQEVKQFAHDCSGSGSTGFHYIRALGLSTQITIYGEAETKRN